MKQLLKEPEGSQGVGLAGRAWGPGLDAVGSRRGAALGAADDTAPGSAALDTALLFSGSGFALGGPQALSTHQGRFPPCTPFLCIIPGKRVAPIIHYLMLKLKLQYLGHLMRRANSLEKPLMLGKTEGRKRRG